MRLLQTPYFWLVIIGLEGLVLLLLAWGCFKLIQVSTTIKTKGKLGLNHLRRLNLLLPLWLEQLNRQSAPLLEWNLLEKLLLRWARSYRWWLKPLLNQLLKAL